MTFHSGIASTATVGGTELPTTEWSVDPSVEIVNFRNSKTDAYSLKEATFKDVNFTITVEFDFDANPFQSPFTFQIGTVLTNVLLYLRGGGSGGSGTHWTFPSAIVVSTPQSVSTEGKITTTLNCTNSGTFTYPA